jgi:tetratricopeptide (TPR) repeat protein
MKRTAPIGLAILLLVAGIVRHPQLLAQAASPQTANQVTDSGKAGAQPPNVFIYFEDGPSLKSANLDGLGLSATTILQTRLLSTMDVHREAAVHSCGAEQNTPLQTPPSPSQEAGKTPGQGRSSDPVFYTISGRFEVEDPQARVPTVVFQYLVKKCSETLAYTLIKQSEIRFPAKHVLEELNGISGFILSTISAEIPRETVSVSLCTMKDVNPVDAAFKQISSSIRDHIVDLLNQSSDFAPSDQAEHTILCEFTPIRKKVKVPVLRGLPGVKKVLFLWDTDSLEVRMLVQSKVTAGTYPALGEPLRSKTEMLKDEKHSAMFVNDVAANALDHLRFIITAEHSGLKVDLDRSQAAAFLQEGKTLLCVSGNCRLNTRDPVRAAGALAAANKLDPGNPEILRYLGQAQLENHQSSNAQTLLQEAHSKLGSRKGKALEAEIDALLGDAYMQQNMFAQARDQYAESLKTYRMLLQVQNDGDTRGMLAENEITTTKKYVRALKATKEEDRALEALVILVRKYPFRKDLHQQIQELISGLSAAQLDRAQEKAGCAAPENVRNECALIAVRKVVSLNDTLPDGGDSSSVLKLALLALSFEPTDVKIRAEALAYAARGSMEVGGPDTDKYLTQAESLPQNDLPASVRDWLLRLRATFWLNKKDYSNAYSTLAPVAHDRQSSSSIRLLAAQTSLIWADSLRADPATAGQAKQKFQISKEFLLPLVDERYAPADEFLLYVNHALGMDVETRDRFRKILDANPRDDSASGIMIGICTELIPDYDCSLAVAKNAASIGFASKPPELQLDFIEAAMLKGDEKTASEWLKVVDSRSELSLQLRPVRDFYEVWLSLDQKDRAAAQTHFLKWQNSLKDLREKKLESIWSFKAAKSVWSGKDTPVAVLLLNMIKALDDSKAELPGFALGPESAPTGNY